MSVANSTGNVVLPADEVIKFGLDFPFREFEIEPLLGEEEACFLFRLTVTVGASPMPIGRGGELSTTSFALFELNGHCTVIIRGLLLSNNPPPSAPQPGLGSARSSSQPRLVPRRGSAASPSPPYNH